MEGKCHKQFIDHSGECDALVPTWDDNGPTGTRACGAPALADRTMCEPHQRTFERQHAESAGLMAYDKQ